ncbi:hypothetical protein B0H14DRAFT_2559039 [Mycena olivaceomarginata]|nr:hypothetical protein B0H14DRAFT_2559039 [Mycena olivaceomarginata]
MASADLSLLHVTCILDWRLGGWGPASRAHWDNSGALKNGISRARCVDELVPRVGQPTVDYLNHICGLSDPTDIANWHEFCKTHENKKLRDWYAHKVQYPWLLPGYNESLSSFPKGYTISQPHQSLVESAHVASNKATKSNLLPGEEGRRSPSCKLDFGGCGTFSRLNNSAPFNSTSFSQGNPACPCPVASDIWYILCIVLLCIP